MKFELEEFHRNTPEEELIADVKRVAKRMRKDSVTMDEYKEFGKQDEYKEFGKYAVSTLTRRLGSWFQILEKAGMRPNRTPMNLSEEDLFKNLEEVWVKLGRQPKYLEMQKISF